jgi:hypothetical protein
MFPFMSVPFIHIATNCPESLVIMLLQQIASLEGCNFGMVDPKDS